MRNPPAQLISGLLCGEAGNSRPAASVIGVLLEPSTMWQMMTGPAGFGGRDWIRTVVLSFVFMYKYEAPMSNPYT